MDRHRDIRISVAGETLFGTLEIPARCQGIVIFAHGSGSSRHSPRNRVVAEALQQVGLGTLLFDLLTAAEERIDLVTAQYRFDIELLAERLAAATDWLVREHAADRRLGYFGSIRKCSSSTVTR